ncbi:MAG: AraC family transcriptional regulator [Desulfobulbaceae bacterium]|nr:AraC family transcriptional regulator [Desulfobulbaceae bacterium]
MMTKYIDKRTGVVNDEFSNVLMASPRRLISTYVDYPKGLSYPKHHHTPCQLLYASKGVMTVSVEQGTWVVPQSHAVWIPSGMNHQIEAEDHLTLRNIYVKPTSSPKNMRQCCVVAMPSLLRELIVYAESFPAAYNSNSHEERILTIILDLLQKLKPAALLLPSVQDKRLQIITTGLIANPGDTRTLDQWAKEVGSTSRTLSRLFKKETGINFKQWRQQARLMEAIRALTSGEQVSSIAFNLGYNSISAFVAMFKKQLGISPGRYLER